MQFPRKRIAHVPPSLPGSSSECTPAVSREKIGIRREEQIRKQRRLGGPKGSKHSPSALCSEAGGGGDPHPVSSDAPFTGLHPSIYPFPLACFHGDQHRVLHLAVPDLPQVPWA